MAKNTRKVGTPAAETPVNPEAIETPEIEIASAPPKVARTLKAPPAEPEQPAVAVRPTPPASRQGPSDRMANPPLHVLNQQYRDQDKARREADPFAGLERVIGERGKRQLARALPQEEAAHLHEQLMKNPPRYRAG